MRHLQIEVIDAYGILSVFATDKGSGRQTDINIMGASTLGSDEVDRMMQDAEKSSEVDKKQREAVDIRNSVRFRSRSVSSWPVRMLGALLTRWQGLSFTSVRPEVEGGGGKAQTESPA